MTAKKNSPGDRFFRWLVRLFPSEFRSNYGEEMHQVFRQQEIETRNGGGAMGFIRLWWETISGIFRTAPREHLYMLNQDVTYGLRMMRKNAGYAFLAMMTLALGIGANTAIFSVAHAVLLAPLPYRDGNNLIIVEEKAPKAGFQDIRFSVPEIQDYRAQNTTLSEFAEYHQMTFTLFGHGEAQRVRTGVVSWTFFRMFGVNPILGRDFLASDDQLGAPAVLLLSYEYWQQSEHGDPDVVGKIYKLNDKVHTVIGVLPKIPQYPSDNDVYMPTVACPFRGAPNFINNRDGRLMRAFGRMKDGVTLEKARTDLATVASRLAKAYPGSYPPEAGFTAGADSVRERLTRNAKPTLLILLGTAGFVLLIACANVANLTLARMSRRERELLVRTAMGAGQSRVLRQLVTEGLLIAIPAGVLGLLFTYSSLHLMTQYVSRLTPRAREIGIDGWVLLFALFAAVATSLFFGSQGAFRSRESIASGIKEGAGQATNATSRRMHNALVVVQVAFSFMLLIGAGLMVRSLLKLQQVDPGFTPQRVLATRVSLNWSKFINSNQYLLDMTRRLEQKLESQPGIISASLSSGFPLNPASIGSGPREQPFAVEGHTLSKGEAPPLTTSQGVTPDYFKTLGIPLIRGRYFTAADKQDGPPVVIISETLMRSFWPNEDPVGHKVSFDNGKNWVPIAGVVGDVREFGLDRNPGNEVYFPLEQAPGFGAVLVRTIGDPHSAALQVRQAILDVDADTAITGVDTLEEARSDSLTTPRVTAELIALFAGLALIIAAAGVGGILALMVSQRTREIGIRMALGASPAAVLRMIMGQGMGLVLGGLAIGFAGAMALTRLMTTLLFGVTPTDPATFAGVALVFLLAAFLACYVPARRATRIDPLTALRME
jgi:putative ABC transport system permease protein